MLYLSMSPCAAAPAEGGGGGAAIKAAVAAGEESRGSQWQLQVFTSALAVEPILRALPPQLSATSSTMTITILTDAPPTSTAEYSKLLVSEEFWQSTVAEHILIFQSDARMLRPIPRQLLRYSFLGAPWPAGDLLSKGNAPFGGGNGGLSLRHRSAMLKGITLCTTTTTNNNNNNAGECLADWCIAEQERHRGQKMPESDRAKLRDYTQRHPQEDCFFSWAMYKMLPSARLPTRKTQREFSMEMLPPLCEICDNNKQCPSDDTGDEGYTERALWYSADCRYRLPLAAHAPWVYWGVDNESMLAMDALVENHLLFEYRKLLEGQVVAEEVTTTLPPALPLSPVCFVVTVAAAVTIAIIAVRGAVDDLQRALVVFVVLTCPMIGAWLLLPA
jgi:hypothetical protein